MRRATPPLLPPGNHFPQKVERKSGEKIIRMGILAVIGVLLPFPYYYVLWNRPQLWVNLCGKSREPCKLMAQVSVFLKLLQFLSIIHVSSFSWPPPLYFWPLMAFGQFLNFRSLSLSLSDVLKFASSVVAYLLTMTFVHAIERKFTRWKLK
ncbi:phosphatidyl-N-methylethanolamine N-methyltransferase [Cucumis melo var. makuwa]|uniref:Phosphatidyl-N-methylethanolamine N-methyltransferase n=2 Tax=Cucumis melo TaxID=3656 RepID=A0A5A7T6B6_CUCMM|nr:phosphatidyl-N-methylethanolamine N-methyltransferase [Cucumis melo var. makuwa]TYK27017.1 phosphatidyl-N-methylethanolamine N-methyltransferase [Cucumis melo var. makuwa]